MAGLFSQTPRATSPGATSISSNGGPCAVSLVDAQPFQGKKKGADSGIDGIKFFRALDKKDVRKLATLRK